MKGRRRKIREYAPVLIASAYTVSVGVIECQGSPVVFFFILPVETLIIKCAVELLSARTNIAFIQICKQFRVFISLN